MRTTRELDAVPGKSGSSADDKAGRKRPHLRHCSQQHPHQDEYLDQPQRRRRWCPAPNEQAGRAGAGGTALVVAVTVPLPASQPRWHPSPRTRRPASRPSRTATVGGDVGQGSYNGPGRADGCHPTVPDGSYRYSHDAGADRDHPFRGTAVRVRRRGAGGRRHDGAARRPATEPNRHLLPARRRRRRRRHCSARASAAGRPHRGRHEHRRTQPERQLDRRVSTGWSSTRRDGTALPLAPATSGPGTDSRTVVSPSDHGGARSSDWPGRVPATVAVGVQRATRKPPRPTSTRSANAEGQRVRRGAGLPAAGQLGHGLQAVRC